jgi:putative NADH-flavin reductase
VPGHRCLPLPRGGPPLPIPHSPFPVHPFPDPHALLHDLADPTLSLADLTHIHRATVPTLEAITQIPRVPEAAAAYHALAELRHQLLTATASATDRAAATAALADLARHAPNPETRRKAATTLLKQHQAPPAPAPAPVPAPARAPARTTAPANPPVSSSCDDSPPPQSIAIFGSTGPTGRHLIDQALGQGLKVTAFARTPAKIDTTHDNLTIAHGDACDPFAVAEAVRGQDAVLCAIGAPGRDTSRIRARATHVIIDAMTQTHVRRLVCLSSFGVGDSKAALPFSLRYLIIPLLLRGAFADHEEQEALVRASDLDWTLIRPPHLNDGPRTGTYTHGFTTQHGLKLRIARADVADFMLRQLGDDRYLNQAAAISN